MAKMTPQEKLIAIAKAEVGYLEKASNANLDSDTANAGKKNWTKYARDMDNLGDFYNGRKNGYDWCDVFVDWCFVKAFGKEMALKLLEAPLKSCGAGVKYSAQYYKGDLYKNAGMFHTSNPQPGDQIFFGQGNVWQHTGLVVKVDSKYVYTIEGNTSGASGVVANGGGVAEKKYLLTYNRIKGYGRPDWSIVGDIVESAEPKPAPTKPATSTSKPKIAGAKSFDKSAAKGVRFTVNARAGLNIRTSPNSKIKTNIIKAVPHGTAVTWYGYYTGDFYYVQLKDKTVGYVHKDYLRKL